MLSVWFLVSVPELSYHTIHCEIYCEACLLETCAWQDIWIPHQPKLTRSVVNGIFQYTNFSWMSRITRTNNLSLRCPISPTQRSNQPTRAGALFHSRINFLFIMTSRPPTDEINDSTIFPLQTRCNLGARKTAFLDVDPEILNRGVSGVNSREMIVLRLHERREIREKYWPTAVETSTDI